MVYNFWFYSKGLRFGPKDIWIPSLSIAISGPMISLGSQEKDEFNEPHREVGSTIPVHLVAGKTSCSWYFSVAFIFSLSITYQWGY